MLLTFRRSTFCCNKTPRLSAARMFVRLYRLLLKHCIYVSVTKPTCPALSAWLNIGSIRSLKVTGKDITLCSFALPSKLCAALHGQSNVGLMCNCKPWGSLDMSVLVDILSGVDNDHCTGQRRNGSVISRSALCPIEKGHADRRRPFKFSSGWLRFVNWTISSWHRIASLNTLFACSILWGCESKIFN